MRRTPDQAIFAQDPFLVERAQVLRRTLRALPPAHLAALIHGLTRDGDRLVAGRLFGSPSGGGCAVGVMLRSLDDERFTGSGLRFLLAHRWRRTVRSYHGELGASPRLRHLEWVFDAAVDRVRELHPDARREATRVVGRWLLQEAWCEHDWRGLEAALAAPAPAHARGAAADALV
jgi:hypothetical protein